MPVGPFCLLLWRRHSWHKSSVNKSYIKRITAGCRFQLHNMHTAYLRLAPLIFYCDSFISLGRVMLLGVTECLALVIPVVPDSVILILPSYDVYLNNNTKKPP